MKNYFIESFKIKKLWGYRDITLTFHKDVNVLIGVNGSGKTTVLNLLYSILTADVLKLLDVNFEQAEINLKGFKGRSERTVTAKVDTTDNLLEFAIEENKFSLNIDAISGRRFAPVNYRDETGRIVRRTLPPHLRRRIVPEELYDELTALVPIVWLPVNRRLPVTEDEDERYTRTRVLESVDLRLEELLRELSHYYSRLNTRLSERYKEFEHEVLSVILYSKEHDQLDSILSSIVSSLPTETEKDQLLRAFDDAGLLNEQMQSRINEHFGAIEKSIKGIKQFSETKISISDFNNILVFPLISRTKDMVEFARKLEKYRKDLFAPLHLYENTVNSFLEDKTIAVGKNDHLQIKLYSQSELNWRDLSSGEKQILILLTQALLRFDKPVVYIADKPELSLHVTWQKKLLESLVTLGGQKQIIVATHSPDIVGKFQDKVIDLGRQS